MTADPDSIVLGSPDFTDTPWADCARQHGALAAWRTAFAQAGTQAALRVKGDFAVALREPSGRVFMAIDRFAVRTLCHRQAGTELRFAARADDLAGADAALDPQAIYDYLYFHAIPSPRTIFRGVFRLPPGHSALFENGRLTITPYWVPEFTEEAQPSFGALRDEFRDLLRQAVRRQIASGNTACFLSGGTDSSSVAGLMAEVTGQPPASYSIGFAAEGYDEMEYARIAARRFKTEHHEYYVTPDDLVQGIPEVAAGLDQPFGNSSVLPAYVCAQKARQDGVTRLLAGDGGDELFGGNTRYAKQRVFDWYGSVPGALRSGLLEPAFALHFIANAPLLKKGSSYIEQAKVPMPDRMQMYNLLLRLGPQEVLTPEFLAQVDQGDPARQQREVWAAAKARSLVDRTLAYDWRYTLAESDLPKVRSATQLAGVEAAFPLLDDDLLAFSMRLKSDYKLRGLKLRWFFKEALRGFLPDEIIAKKKHGFGLPFGVWVNQHAGLRKLATDTLEGLRNRGIVRPEFLDALVKTHLPAHPGYYGEMVWILIMLEQWLQSRTSSGLSQNQRCG